MPELLRSTFLPVVGEGHSLMYSIRELAHRCTSRCRRGAAALSFGNYQFFLGGGGGGGGNRLMIRNRAECDF